MRVFKLSLSFLVSLALLAWPLSFSVRPAQAATFGPIYSASVSSVTAGANPNVQFRITNPVGSEFVSSFVISIPPGWPMPSGTDIGDNVQIGDGTFTADFGAGQQTIPFVILNKVDLQAHKMHLVADFAPFPTRIDVFLDGDTASGHTISVTRPPLSLQLPTDLIFTLYGLPAGVAFFTIPQVAGEYTFSAQFTSGSGAVVIRALKINLPARTPNGSNITNNFTGGIAVTFGKVIGTGGVTTISSSTSPPPSGTGQFQLSGGLYYDFNTTANIKCPCTVTMPYDPAVTSNPRIYHLENGVWVDITTSFDPVAKTVTGVASSFSFFAVGGPNYSVDWHRPIERFLERKGNPFPLKDDKNLEIKFNLLDPTGDLATPVNVSVEIWQTEDADGNSITPIKLLTLDPQLQVKKSRYQTRLDLKQTPLDLGTYEIRVVVDNTTSTQSPQTASFFLVDEASHDNFEQLNVEETED